MKTTEKSPIEEMKAILHRKQVLNVEMKFLESEARITFSRTIEQTPLTIEGINLLTELFNEFPYDYIQARMYEIIENISDTIPEDIEGVKMLIFWWHSFSSNESQRKEEIETKINTILPKILETIPYTQSNIDLLGQLEIVFSNKTGEIWWSLIKKRAEIREYLTTNCK